MEFWLQSFLDVTLLVILVGLVVAWLLHRAAEGDRAPATDTEEKAP